MNESERIRFLERQVEHLSTELTQAMRALELASTLGNVARDLGTSDSPQGILQETVGQAGALVPFEVAGVYVVNEDDADFVLEHVDPPEQRQTLEAEVNRLIADHSFAWALQRPQTTVFASPTDGAALVLHPLATPSRIRGMLVLLLGRDKKQLSDVTLSLLSILAASSAYALESQALYNTFRAFNRNLERKIQERTRQLNESKAVMQSILDTMHTGVALIDYATQKIVEVNPAALNILGYTREELLGRECYATICPKLKGSCPIIDLGQTVDSSERVARRRDGSPVPILKSVASFVLDGRRYLAESFIDITEFKEHEKLREDVDRIIRHDLKTPLNAICGFPQLLLLGENLDGEQRQYIRHIEEAGFRMLDMINLSLDLYKMERGVYQYTPRPVDLLRIVRKVLYELQELVRSKALSVQLLVNGRPVGEGDACQALGEELLCYSMLANLTRNAIEASPEGGAIRVVLDSAEGLRVGITNAGEVPPEFRPRFFDKYATLGKKGGSGLGTYSARLMAETMGCRTELDTTEPGLTTVRVRFG